MNFTRAFKRCFFISCLSLCLNAFLEVNAAASWQASDNKPSNSVLSEGDWYKLSVSDYGIYKLDYNFLQEMGINLNTIDPARIKIFGKGGGMLPQKNNAERSTGLTENAIYVKGEEDGKFNQEDFILFYAEGPDLYHYDEEGRSFFYQKNLYADSSYYFLHIADDNGLRVQTRANAGADYPKITYFDDYGAYEKDNENILASGREWYGEKFDLVTTHTLPAFTFPGILDNSTVKVVSSVLSQSNSPSSFTLSINDAMVAEQKLRSISVGTYDIKGFPTVDTLTIPSSTLSLGESSELNFKYTYNKGSFGTSAANLNFLFVQVKRTLALYNNHTIFRSIESLKTPIVSYYIKNTTSEVVIWDITSPQNPVQQTYEIKDGQAIFGADSEKLREFIIFKGNDFPLPVFNEKIKNQNLHGENVPELLIVTFPPFKQEAERLASFRSQHDHLSVKTVTTLEIYNEFSSGRQDVTAIRDYVKYLYDQNKGLKYLLLFGKSSYDYKGFIEENTNFVPTYESRNSLNPVETYSSDDYYGFLDENEGEWPEDQDNNNDHFLDIGVGRLPVKSIEEAKTIVDKLIHYSSSQKALGAWRNEVYLVADDGDRNTHQNDAEKIALLSDTSYAQFNINKIYIDAYRQEFTPNGESAEAVRDEIDEAIKKGALIINYTGHGAESGWAEENVLTTSMINEWKNYDRMPLFVTATCEFGRHDDPQRISGGEMLLSNPEGGAIGLVTTSRPVFSSSNFLLNKAFINTVFKQIEGNYLTLGEIFKRTKNESISGVRNRNFSLLADPSMKLAYPKQKMVVYGASESEENDTVTLSALSKIVLNGEIQDNQSNKLNNYKGIAYVTVYDKPYTVETFGTEFSPVMSFEQRDNIIFRGKASVKNGAFTIAFVVPKNIAYDLGKAKISLYAKEENTLNDAHGANTNFIIGGSNPEAPNDNTAPGIVLYMNDTTFQSGDITGSNTRLIAHITDESGINISGRGLGQGITAQINDNDPFILNDFYESDLNNYKSGTVSYPINDLPKGKYMLNLKAWDTYNNASENTIEFIVADDAVLALDQIFNYPNPFSNETQFIIKHNRAGENLSVKIIIYSIKGELIKEIQGEFQNSNATIDGLSWNGHTDFGEKLDNGIYIYKVIVQSREDTAKNQQLQKLVIIN